jgi:hypothetical protein
MCAGTIYWAHIGRLVYLASESGLRKLTGKGNKENLTLDLPCRVVFDRRKSRLLGRWGSGRGGLCRIVGGIGGGGGCDGDIYSWRRVSFSPGCWCG